MLVEKLQKDMIEAMKNKDKEKLSVIRMVKAALDKERIDQKKEVNDDLLIDVVNKQIKMRNDSIEEFNKAGRIDLVDKAKQEVVILKEYLPEQLEEDEVISIIDDVVATIENPSIKSMGQIMKEITPKIKGRFDMKKVSEIIKSKLN